MKKNQKQIKTNYMKIGTKADKTETPFQLPENEDWTSREETN